MEISLPDRLIEDVHTIRIRTPKGVIVIKKGHISIVGTGELISYSSSFNNFNLNLKGLFSFENDCLEFLPINI